MHWLLPLLISIGMAIGALLGMLATSDAALQAGPAGDLAGAFGALTMMTCFLVGLLVSTITLTVRALLKRPPPRRLLLRCAVGIAGGALVGTFGSTSLLRDTLIPWLPMLAIPAAASWSWRSQDR